MFTRILCIGTIHDSLMYKTWQGRTVRCMAESAKEFFKEFRGKKNAANLIVGRSPRYIVTTELISAVLKRFCRKSPSFGKSYRIRNSLTRLYGTYNWKSRIFFQTVLIIECNRVIKLDLLTRLYLHGMFLEWWNTTKSFFTIWLCFSCLSNWWGDCKNMQEIEILPWLSELPAR